MSTRRTFVIVLNFIALAIAALWFGLGRTAPSSIESSGRHSVEMQLVPIETVASHQPTCMPPCIVVSRSALGLASLQEH